MADQPYLSISEKDEEEEMKDNRPDSLTLGKLQQARVNMILSARQEFKENGFILYSGRRFGKTELHKLVTVEEAEFKEIIKTMK